MDDSDRVQVALTSLGQELLTIWQTEQASVPQVLYHYTSAEGLSGILTSQSFWMTDIRYMNDLSESQYAMELLIERLNTREGDNDLSTVQRDFLARVLDIMPGLKYGPSTFCVSFCEEGNLLSQWRAYRGLGGGYALGIDFFHAFRLLDRRCFIRKLIYDPVAQQSLLDRAIQSYLTTVGTLADSSGTTTEDVVSGAARSFGSVITALLSFFKHPSFSEEHEWRLLHIANVDPLHDRSAERPRLRTFDGNIIPYIVVSFAKAIEAATDDVVGIEFPLVDVVVGPTVNSELNQTSIGIALHALAPDVRPRIRASEIPLRWL